MAYKWYILPIGIPELWEPKFPSFIFRALWQQPIFFRASNLHSSMGFGLGLTDWIVNSKPFVKIESQKTHILGGNIYYKSITTSILSEFIPRNLKINHWKRISIRWWPSRDLLTFPKVGGHQQPTFEFWSCELTIPKRSQTRRNCLVLFLSWKPVFFIFSCYSTPGN